MIKKINDPDILVLYCCDYELQKRRARGAALHKPMIWTTHPLLNYFIYGRVDFLVPNNPAHTNAKVGKIDDSLFRPEVEDHVAEGDDQLTFDSIATRLLDFRQKLGFFPGQAINPVIAECLLSWSMDDMKALLKNLDQTEYLKTILVAMTGLVRDLESFVVEGDDKKLDEAKKAELKRVLGEEGAKFCEHGENDGMSYKRFVQLHEWVNRPALRDRLPLLESRRDSAGSDNSSTATANSEEDSDPSSPDSPPAP